MTTFVNNFPETAVDWRSHLISVIVLWYLLYQLKTQMKKRQETEFSCGRDRVQTACTHAKILLAKKMNDAKKPTGLQPASRSV